MNFQKDYDIAIPEPSRYRSGRKMSEESLEILKFVESEHETMCFTYPDKQTAKKRYASLTAIVKRKQIPVKLMIRTNKLYVKKSA